MANPAVLARSGQLYMLERIPIRTHNFDFVISEEVQEQIQRTQDQPYQSEE